MVATTSLIAPGASWTPTVVTTGSPSRGIATNFSSLTSKLIAMNGATVAMVPARVAADREGAERHGHGEDPPGQRDALRRGHQGVDAGSFDARPRRAAGPRDVVGTDDGDLVLPPDLVQSPVLVRDVPVPHQVEPLPHRHRVGHRDRQLRRGAQLVSGELQVVRRQVSSIPPVSPGAVPTRRLGGS